MTHIDARSTELERRALSRSLETTNDRGVLIVEPVNCEQTWPILKNTGQRGQRRRPTNHLVRTSRGTFGSQGNCDRALKRDR
jgi:hypothetical protein